MDQDRQDYDNLAWDVNDDAWEEAQKYLRLSSTCDLVVSLVARKFGRNATLVTPLRIGGFNILYRVHVEGKSPDVMIRLPCPSLAQFPDEKTIQEAATALFLCQNTQIPVPKLFCYSRESEIGPFIILQHVENDGDMVDALAVPGLDPSTPPVLYEDISETQLSCLYYRLACCLLQLSQHGFPRIGSLVEADGGLFVVSQRPITQNMNNMLQLANIPRSVLPPRGRTYQTADDWYVALAEMHLAQLVFQHNDLVSSTEDCRNKYVARQLFFKLAKQKKLSNFGFVEDDWSAQSTTTSSTCPAPDGSGQFRLWCDDMRPTNFLVNQEKEIVAAIDWEFTYAAPTQFVLDPPWWLLLELPEMWSTNIDDWALIFERRLETWLSSMQKAEQTIKGYSSGSINQSDYMRESWKNGRFWLNYAARKSWAFDTIFWKFLDERFFGSREKDIPLWKARLHLLSTEEKMAMEPFVENKMMESKERTLVSWDPRDAKAHLSRVLFK